MAKTNEELQELKEKVENLDKELKELSDDELEQVSGGRISIKVTSENKPEKADNKPGKFVHRIISAGH
jgi:bacteriocin-type signal sequence